jgi:hypothetical protein
MAPSKPGFLSHSDRSKAQEDIYDNTESTQNARYDIRKDVFGDETGNGIRYRTLTWPLVAFLMITEIVTYGTLSLPYSLAVVGIVPGVILIVFLGAFALYTALILIKFKINHPEGIYNHSMLQQ